MTKKIVFILILMWCLRTISQPKNNIIDNASGTLKITFVNVVNDSPMILRNRDYQNPFGETYTINKFKYYVSNIVVRSSSNSFSEINSYHLINQEDSASLSFTFNIPTGVYDSFSFLLGVDSLHNVSGAQTDALDPVNDMFWTWNSGYVMAKMEGKSKASVFNNTFEFHIGGFQGPYNVLKNIDLNLSPKTLIIHGNRTSEIIIKADSYAWWQKPYDIEISANANITSPGILAKKVSDNYAKMFSVINVINN
jgi:hypothetical protein